MGVEQKNVTRNQSTALYTLEQVFLFNNKYDSATFDNTTAGAEVALVSGMLMFKLAADTVDVLEADTQIASVVGIAAVDGELVVANTATAAINIAISGEVAEEKIVLPGGITLDTVVPTTMITLRDTLNGLGFHLVSGVENTKHDNN